MPELTEQRLKKLWKQCGITPVKGWEACDLSSGEGKTLFAHLEDTFLDKQQLDALNSYGVYINSYKIVVCAENIGHAVVTLDKDQPSLQEEMSK